MGFAAQDAGKDAVERARPQSARGLTAHELSNAPRHLARRLVGERQRENGPGRYAVGQQVRNFIGQHARLTRASTRYDERRAVAVADGLPLCRVQTLPQLCVVEFHRRYG